MPGTRDEDQIYIYYIKISPLPFALLLFWLLVCLPTGVPQANTHLMTFAFVVYSSWNAQLLNALMDHFFFFFSSFEFLLNCYSQEDLPWLSYLKLETLPST